MTFPAHNGACYLEGEKHHILFRRRSWASPRRNTYSYFPNWGRLHLQASGLLFPSWWLLMSPSCQTAPSFWPPKHTCSLPPKLTCLRVCWGPRVKSLPVCGPHAARPPPQLLHVRCGLDLTCICWNEKEGTWGVNTWRLQSRGCWEQWVGAGTCKVLLFAFATQRLPPLQIFCQPRLYWSPVLGQWK